MSDCCTSSYFSRQGVNKRSCPVNGKTYTKVSTTTIYHHIKQSWNWTPSTDNYYFCNDPECDVVYFGDDDSIISNDKLRTRVGVKTNNGADLVCYCFGVTFNDAKENSTLKSFVLQKTKEQICACDVRNPSGRCCLKDFPKTL